MTEYVVERTDVSFIVVEADSLEDALQIAEISIDGWDIDIGDLVAREL